ncbi:MAG: cobyrinate a,c-diamide synthase [Sarcina sp.]
MKSIIISSNSSGGGKTTVTLGLMRALQKRNFKIQGYKVGPDYIDPAFHRKVLNVSSKNLDLHLMGENGVKSTFLKGKGDFAVIEGVMGLYDGKGVEGQCSTYEISKVLNNTPIVLVLDAKGKSTTIAAELKGILEFKNPNIVGIIFNKVNKNYFTILKAIVNKYFDIEVFGYIEENEKISLESRHLGLVQAIEIEDIKEKIENISNEVSKNIDLDLMIKHFKKLDLVVNKIDKVELTRKKKLNIAVALDESFNFYYEENINLLKKLGNITYFSPLRDKKFPENIDFIYIGGGYPEVFKKELSKNESFRKSFKENLDKGIHCYAECGGLMYLTEDIEGEEMVGFFKGGCKMTNKLQNFGYSTLESLEKQNIKINCHEFHKSIFETEEKNIYKFKKISFLGSEKIWYGGYKKNNTIATYSHVHFLGNLKFLDFILPKE